jgi:hypothetical protein
VVHTLLVHEFQKALLGLAAGQLLSGLGVDHPDELHHPWMPIRWVPGVDVEINDTHISHACE